MTYISCHVIAYIITYINAYIITYISTYISTHMLNHVIYLCILVYIIPLSYRLAAVNCLSVDTCDLAINILWKVSILYNQSFLQAAIRHNL